MKMQMLKMRMMMMMTAAVYFSTFAVVGVQLCLQPRFFRGYFGGKVWFHRPPTYIREPSFFFVLLLLPIETGEEKKGGKESSKIDTVGRDVSSSSFSIVVFFPLQILMQCRLKRSHRVAAMAITIT